MATFERSTLVRAPLEEVWRFHATVDGLVAVTPDWLDLRVHAVVGPDGEATAADEPLVEGSEVTLSIRPLGLLPRQSWTSRVTRLERGDDRARFRDEMRDGPFPHWRHDHQFAAVPAGTRVTDRLAYQLPLGPARGLSALGWPGFEALFAHRHRATRRLLE